MTITNQKPAVLSPVYMPSIQGDFDPVPYLKKTLAEPLYDPVVQSQPVVISANGQNITADDVTDQVLQCCSDIQNMTAEMWCKTIYGKTLAYFDAKTPLNIRNLFAVQAAVQEKLPWPTSTCIYTPATDVIPTSKEFLAGRCTYEKYFGTMAFYSRPESLGFYFANETAFDAFKAWLATELTNWSAMFQVQANTLYTDFQANIKLSGLTESLILRNNDSENNEEYSFARTIIWFLMRYTQQVSSAEFGVLPFDVAELYCPRTIIFVNVEKHAHATAKQVADEWAIIEKSLKMNINMISNNKLSKLTATARAMQRISQQAANAATNMGQGVGRSANVRFRKTAPTTIDVVRILKKIIAKMGRVAKSENSYKSVKATFAKPNRRDPDDFNKQGKSVSTQYKPDLHIYVDTSGSISELNYQDAIRACIQIARKLNVNLYFNSFSHCLSQCTKLTVKDRTLEQVYRAFQKVPKVSGGTDYEQIWNYINKSKKRQRELSIIITDFEWDAPNRFIRHPDNLYYMPCSHMNWNAIRHNAINFTQSMQHIDANIRKHIMF